MAMGAQGRSSELAYHFLGSRWVCAYCGDPADTIDHTVPSWFAEGNTRLIERCQLFKVASCLDCNVRAGGKVDQTFIRRKRRIALNLRKKHRLILGVADWEESEIQKLGPGMRQYVLSGVRLRKHLMVRLELLESGLMPEGMPDHFFYGLLGEEPQDENHNVELAESAHASAQNCLPSLTAMRHSTAKPLQNLSIQSSKLSQTTRSTAGASPTSQT